MTTATGMNNETDAAKINRARNALEDFNPDAWKGVLNNVWGEIAYDVGQSIIDCGETKHLDAESAYLAMEPSDIRDVVGDQACHRRSSKVGDTNWADLTFEQQELALVALWPDPPAKKKGGT